MFKRKIFVSISFIQDNAVWFTTWVTFSFVCYLGTFGHTSPPRIIIIKKKSAKINTKINRIIDDSCYCESYNSYGSHSSMYVWFRVSQIISSFDANKWDLMNHEFLCFGKTFHLDVKLLMADVVAMNVLTMVAIYSKIVSSIYNAIFLYQNCWNQPNYLKR